MTKPRYKWHEPILRGDPPIICAGCGTEIGAAATNERTISINGLYGHLWAHVETGVPWCTVPPPPARPEDPWAAQLALDAHRNAGPDYVITDALPSP